MTAVERVAKLMELSTAGPWHWLNDKHSTYLATKDRGRRYVMGFVRRGMQGAQPLFQVYEEGSDYGVMRTADEIDNLNQHPDARAITLAINLFPKYAAVAKAARQALPLVSEVSKTARMRHGLEGEMVLVRRLREALDDLEQSALAEVGE